MILKMRLNEFLWLEVAEEKNILLLLQGVTLALARSPRRVSKVLGERKSSTTRPFGEHDFRCQEII